MLLQSLITVTSAMAVAVAAKKPAEMRQASFVLVGDSTTFNSTTPNCAPRRVSPR